MATRISRTVSDKAAFLAAEDGSAGDALATSTLEVVAEFPVGQRPRIALHQRTRVNGWPQQRIEVALGGTAGASAVAAALRDVVEACDREADERADHPERLQPESPAALCLGLLEFLRPMAGSSSEVDGWIARLENSVIE